MTKNPDRSLALWAIDVLSRFAPPAMERGPANDPHTDLVRHYVGDPAVDQFKRECKRDEPYRGRRGVAGNGDEWLRRVRLENAGQLDAFEE
jgi:hypothetical protein